MTETDQRLTRRIVREETDDLRVEFAGMKTSMTGMKADIGSMKAKIGGMKAEMGSMKAEISGVKAEMTEMKTGIRDLRVQFEHFDHKIDTIAELVTTTVRTRNEVTDLTGRVDRLEMDVSMLKRPRP